MSCLSISDIQYAISDLNGWEFKNNAIHKIFTFESYLNSIAFINRLVGDGVKSAICAGLMTGIRKMS